MDENSGTTGASLPDRDSNVRYRSGDVRRFRVGHESELVYCRNTGATGLLHSELAALIGCCASFKTLEQHARDCSGGDKTAGDAMSLTRMRLQELAESGFLISEREVFERLPQLTARPPAATTIGSMCFPTCNRVDALRRCLQSHITNCRQYGRTNDFVVMDDAADQEVGKACRQMLTVLKAEDNAHIKYGGSKEKHEFLSRLIESKALPADVVRFALFGDEESGLATYGANHNAILLHTIGDAIFCTDDDTVCRIATASTTANGIVAVSGADSPGRYLEETWLFPDRETALKSVAFVDACLLDMHERFLGMELGTCITLESQSGPVDLDQTDVHFNRMLGSGNGRIRVTVNGILGDSGREVPTYCHFLTGSSLDRLTRNQSEYLTQSTSREFLRMVNRVTISENPPAQGTFLGLDNRQLLPPYLPVGRGQDILFGQVLSLCFCDNYYVRLPWALLHEPVEKRCFLPEQIVERRPGLDGVYALIGLLAGSLDSGRWKADSNARLHILGSYLEELACLPAVDFQELVSLLAWREASGEISRLERAINQAGEARQFWVDDVRAYIKNRRDRLMEREAFLPYELCERRGTAKAPAIAQQLVRRYGQLLQWWPDIVESARKLREQGRTLAQPI